MMGPTGSATSAKRVSKDFILKWVWDKIAPKTMYSDIEPTDQQVYDTLKELFSGEEKEQLIPLEVWNIDAEWKHLGDDISRILRNKFMEAVGIGGEEGANMFAKEATEYWYRIRVGIVESVDCIKNLKKEGSP